MKSKFVILAALVFALASTLWLVFVAGPVGTRPTVALDERQVLAAARRIASEGDNRLDWHYLEAAFRQASPSFDNLLIQKKAVVELGSRRWQCFYVLDVSSAFKCQTPRLVTAFNGLCAPEFFGASEMTPATAPALDKEPACSAATAAQVEQLMAGLSFNTTR